MLVWYSIRMMKKLTITVSEEVYNGLYAKIGAGRISRFLDGLARQHVINNDIIKGYEQMSKDEAREKHAEQWVSELMNEAW
ncbi:hypothetical protein [Dokdonia pacifica]|uniref:hypothetical protein n=1 Tax=Dokdonia pacifica TaxID=1627892 RepID=UPI001C527E98|nr:hypothetical protein [Dokdonia pacifica]